MEAHGSKLPENQVYLTNSKINSVPFSDDLVIDHISIRMIKRCDESLLRPLSIIFRNSLKSSIYPSTWKKANVIPVHNKDDKQCTNNYRPVSVFGKIFNEIYSFLDREKLLNTNQSGFRPFDSCVNQLLTITHKIFSAFDCNPSLEVHLIFLDISKAFDKVWDDGLLYKLKSFGISGSLLNLIKHYLTDIFQRVLLNGQCLN